MLGPNRPVLAPLAKPKNHSIVAENRRQSAASPAAQCTHGAHFHGRHLSHIHAAHLAKTRDLRGS